MDKESYKGKPMYFGFANGNTITFVKPISVQVFLIDITSHEFALRYA